MDNHQYINQTSDNTEWWTPKPIVRVASRLMGGIDLDVACSPAAWEYQEWHAESIIPANALSVQWFGKVWMNHPFGRGRNQQWVEYLTRFHTQRDVTQACCITFASVSERWFQPLLRFPQFFFCGRVNYIDPATLTPVKGVTKGSVFTYLYDFEQYEYEGARQALRDAMEIDLIEGVAK